MIPIKISVGPLASAAANNIALSQTPGGAVALTLNGSLVSGGVAVLDTPRTVLVTTVSDESGKTLTITGTNWAGDVISEVVTGPAAGTGATVLSYRTVTSIVVSAAFTGAVTVGTTTTATSPWVKLDGWALPSVAMACVVVGTVNYTVQQSMDDPNSATFPVTPVNMTWISSADTGVVGATATKMTSFSAIPVWVRVLLNSGTGSVTATLQQSGAVSY